MGRAFVFDLKKAIKVAKACTKGQGHMKDDHEGIVIREEEVPPVPSTSCVLGRRRLLIDLWFDKVKVWDFWDSAPPVTEANSDLVVACPKLE